MRKPIDRLQRDRQASQASICTAEYYLQSTAGIHTIMSRYGFHPWISRYIWITDESASSDRALHFTRGKTEAEEDLRCPRTCTKEVSGRAQTDLRFYNRFYKLSSDFTTPQLRPVTKRASFVNTECLRSHCFCAGGNQFFSVTFVNSEFMRGWYWKSYELLLPISIVTPGKIGQQFFIGMFWGQIHERL